MALTLSEALAATVLSGSISQALTVPANAVGLCITVVSHGNGSPVSVAPAFGGLAMTARAGGGHSEAYIDCYDVLDLSARANDTLTLTTTEGVILEAAFLVSTAGIPTRIDAGQDIGNASPRINLDPAGAPLTAAYVAGWGTSSGAVGTGNISPAGSQTQLSESTINPGLTTSVTANVSYLLDLVSATNVGVDVSVGGAQGGAAAMLYDDALPFVVMTAMPGAEAGIPSGFEVTQGDPVVIAHPFGIAGAAVGIPSGFEVTATGPAQVLLAVPGHERPQMTEGGEDDQVLTFHTARPPSWEDPAGGPGGGLTVEEDGETPITSVDHIVVIGATVTDDTGGQVTITISAGAAALDDLTDVDAPTPADGDVLTWDNTAGEWVAAPAAGGTPGPLKVYMYERFK